MTIIREALDSDVEKIRDLFATVYGEDYPFPGFYDTNWLKKAVFNDDTLFLIAEHNDKVVATGSVMLDVGGLNDMIGELGRLVASPAKQSRGAAQELIGQLLERIKNRVQFAFGEVRTVHRGSQRLAENFGWVPVGFEPLKYQFQKRESVAFFAKVQGIACELRRNNPRVIPEIFPLAQTVLDATGLPVDAICYDETDGYPTGQSFKIDRLNETGISPLLRIERGRVTNREVFGNFSLSHGFFRISDSNSHYLVARQGAAILGAIGFTYDPIDAKVRIFELIEFDDAVKGYLLASVDKIACNEFKAAYQEVDISAYSPKMQRTLERLGFVPVAYCPSMVFDNVERLDIIRMAKLNIVYDLGKMKLLKSVEKIKDIIEHTLQDRLIGMEITAGSKKAQIFNSLLAGDLHHLASIALLRDYPAGKKLISDGETAQHLYVVAEGEAEVRKHGKVIACLGEGSIFGEMSLIEDTVRSADVVLSKPSKIIEIEIKRFERLLESHPRLGYIVTRNLAKGLSSKLREKK